MEKKIEDIEHNFNSNNYSKTIELCNSFFKSYPIKKFPKNLFILNYLGTSLSLTRNYTKSVEVFKEGLKIDSKNINLKSNLAKVYKDSKEYTKAIKIYNELHNQTNNGEFYLQIGVCYFDSNDFTKSKEIFEKVIIEDASNIIAIDYLSQTLIKLKEFDRALSYINKGLQIKVNNPYFLNNKAIVFKFQKKYKEAISLLKKIPANSNQFPKYVLYNNIGSIYEDAGDDEKAKNYYFKSLEINKRHELTNYNIGKIFKKENELELAKDYFNKAGGLGKIKLLELFYFLDDRKNFNRLIEEYEELEPHNNNVAAMSAFASEQWGITNNYSFCHNPILFLKYKNIIEDLKDLDFSFSDLSKELNELTEIWEPEDTTTKKGSQTFDNLFSLKKNNISKLKDLLKDEIRNYLENYRKDNSRYIKSWPKNYNIFGWVVNLQSGGFQSSHIHMGAWLSGVFYLSIPDDIKKNDGAIKFSLQGFDYPMKKNSSVSEIINPKKGDLVLFPSSLFHQTTPFDSNKNRICIAFDIIPK